MKTKVIRILAFSFNVIILYLLIDSFQNIGYFKKFSLSYSLNYVEMMGILILLIGFIHNIMFFVFFFSKNQKMDELIFLKKREDMLKLKIENESLKKELNEIEKK
jgi:hypothetical protein